MINYENELKIIISGKVFSAYTASTVCEIAKKEYNGSIENGIKCLEDAAISLKKTRNAVESGEMSKRVNPSINALNNLLMAV